MSKVIVIGGGAGGMMAAIAAAEQGHHVILLEKNEKLGKKIYITGKGRCNVTNDCDMEELFDNVVTNSKFLYSAFYTFDNQRMKEYLEEDGCRLKVERGNRVFPVSDHASDVIGALKRRMNRLGVQVFLNTEVKEILKADGEDRVVGVLLTNGKKEPADAVILAGGGLSYPTTGSNGSGIRLAEKLGHTVSKCVPALVPLETAEEFCKEMQGVSLKNVAMEMKKGKKTLYSGFGEMMFTHFGVTGPLVLSASSFLPKEFEPGEIRLYLDLKPALSTELLDKRILRDFEEIQNRQLKNGLDKLLPTKMIPVVLKLSGLNVEKKINTVSKEERLSLVHLLKCMELTVKGTRGFNEAIITKGGIKVKEVNPATMESKLVSGLYLVGEMLDLDALTGGFNLQIAWSTGYLAGFSVPHKGQDKTVWKE